MGYLASETTTVSRPAPPLPRHGPEEALAELELLRQHKVRAVLEAREVCARSAVVPIAGAGSDRHGEAQLLLSAAVSELEELDGRLQDARNKR